MYCVPTFVTNIWFQNRVKQDLGKSRPCALTKHRTVKTYGGMEVEFHAFLTSELDGGEWSASSHGRFTPGTQEAGWTPKPAWTRWLREKYPAPPGNRTPIVQPVT
jgi:hypothetical protein